MQYAYHIIMHRIGSLRFHPTISKACSVSPKKTRLTLLLPSFIDLLATIHNAVVRSFVALFTFSATSRVMLRCFIATALVSFATAIDLGPIPGPSPGPFEPCQGEICVLTAGDIDDNLNFLTYEIYKNRIYNADAQLEENFQYLLPNHDLTDHITVLVKDSAGSPFSCATVEVDGTSVELSAGSDGRLSMFSAVDNLPERPWTLTPKSPDGDTTGTPVMVTDEDGNDLVNLSIDVTSTTPNTMDLAVVLDTTGSMCDEIEFLQAELASVISSFNTEQIDLRLAMVFYRDTTDTYITSKVDFANPETGLAALAVEFCDGGGDSPEAVHTAWEEANTLSWRKGNVARVALLIGDAPPHQEDMQAAFEAALDLRQKGVRLYGLAASDTNSVVEYLFRTVSLLSHGRYIWLTSDSAIGDEKTDAKVACFQVTELQDLLTRVLRGELEGRRIEAVPQDIIREVGTQTAGICLIDMNDPESALAATGNAGGAGSEFLVGKVPPTSAPTTPAPAPAFFCFSGDSTVDVMDKGPTAMKNLKLGGMVSVGGNEYAKVYSFGHYDQTVKAEYLQIHIEDLKDPLEISNNHMLFVQHGSTQNVVPASVVTVGDLLVLGSGGFAIVTKISTVERTGAFAPFTTTGTIAVNGVVASSYVSLQEDSGVFKIGEIETTVSMQWLAHAFQAHHRIVCELSWSYCEKETYDSQGVSHWVTKPLSISQWILSQNVWVMAVVSVFVLVAATALVSVELIVLKPWALVVACTAILSFRGQVKKASK